MILSRRAVLLLGFCFFLVFFFTARGLSRSWRNVPQVVGLGEYVGSPGTNWTVTFNSSSGRADRTPYAPQPIFVPGTPKPPGYQYSKTLVVPRTKEEDVGWIERELPDWNSAIYVVDDPKAPLHPPKNKGHEVMVYLTYVIDFYDRLPDVVVFMHSHQNAWHNEEIFNTDSAVILRRLSLDRVTREGYMNTRCNHGPGCPDWMHPGTMEEDETKQEEVMLARAWAELFPDEPVPSVLAQPCCAQFAVSRERIQSIPRSRFIYYRDWLLQTALSDYIAGRIWEYMWQYVFTGKPVVCVDESVCLCDGYGVCFGGPSEYQEYMQLDYEKKELQKELEDWMFLAGDIDFAQANDELDESVDLSIPFDRKSQVQKDAGEKDAQITRILTAAFERGKDPKNRAQEAGRSWKEGDGF